MLRLPADRYSRIVIALRVLLPAVALAGIIAPFVLETEGSRFEKLTSTGESKFASLQNSDFRTLTPEGYELQVRSDNVDWENEVATAGNIFANAADENGMEVEIHSSIVERVGNAETIFFGGGSELTTNFGYSMVSDGFKISSRRMDFNSVGEVFLTFPGGFGAVGHLDFEPDDDAPGDAKYPGSLKLENNVIIVFKPPES